jgi:hypothetical protein
MEALFYLLFILTFCFGPFLLILLLKEISVWLRRWLDHRARIVELRYAVEEAQLRAQLEAPADLPEWVDAGDAQAVEQWRRAQREVTVGR